MITSIYPYNINNKFAKRNFNNNKNYSKNETPSQTINIQTNYPKEINFKGITKIFALTDIHQYADRHCKLVNEVLKNSQENQNVVILDNGDLFKGIYPKDAVINTYIEAKKSNPELEIVFNIGNNDPGYDVKDRNLFYQFVNDMNVLSANIFDKTTGKRPIGIKPYTIIERDNDKMMYIGFSVNTFDKEVPNMVSKDPIEILDKLAPEIKQTVKDENIKGIVFLVHDELATITKLKDKARELGLDVKFAIGGHVHYPYEDKINNIFMPEPFGKSLTTFELNFNSDKNVFPENLSKTDVKNCNLGIYSSKIDKINARENYYTPIAKSVKELDFIWDDIHLLRPSELGTFYADGIKDITNSEIGIVPKGWIYDKFPYKPNDTINKMDILTYLPQPIKPIYQIKVTPNELKDIYQIQMDSKNRIMESSQNVVIGMKDKKITQIFIDGKPLFDEKGNAINPQRKIITAIDYFTVKDLEIDKQKSSLTMYDGIVSNLKKLEKFFKENEKYPISGLIEY